MKENIAKNGMIPCVIDVVFEKLLTYLCVLSDFIPILVMFKHFTPYSFVTFLHAGFVVDKEDTSVTRSDAYFRDLFKQTGFHLYKTKVRT